MADSLEHHDSQRRAVIVGLGLIGTSLALALREKNWYVSGCDLDTTREKRALELEAIDAIGPDPSAELAFVATPAHAVADCARDLLEAATGDLVVSDVAGVKGRILSTFDHPHFVGGHPMAGSEQEGPDGADPALFAGATWVLTPTEKTDSGAYALVSGVVGDFGGEVVTLAPGEHDALVAVVSHLPHLVAANLMVLADDASSSHAPLLRLAAGGFRDMTRIAAGDPAIWPDIFQANAEAVVGVLDDLIERLTVARAITAAGDRTQLVALLERARHARRNLPARVARPETIAELRVPVPDRPGVLAEVTSVLSALAINIFDLEIAHSAEGPRGVLVIAIDESDGERARAALLKLGYHPAISGFDER